VPQVSRDLAFFEGGARALCINDHSQPISLRFSPKKNDASSEETFLDEGGLAFFVRKFIKIKILNLAMTASAWSRFTVKCLSYYLPFLLVVTVSFDSSQLIIHVVRNEQTNQWLVRNIHLVSSTEMNNTEFSIHNLAFASSCISSPGKVAPPSSREIYASVSLLTLNDGT